MRTLLLGVVLVGCDDKAESTGAAPTDTPTVETDLPAPETTFPSNPRLFVPKYVNIDAAFGVDQAGQVVAVTDPEYGPVVPTITLYIGSEYWSVGDWGSDELCTVVLEITSTTPNPSLEIDRGMWFGFDTVTLTALDHDCDDMEQDGTDPNTFAEGINWSIALGELSAGYASYASYDYVGGFTGNALDPAPDDDDGRAVTAYGFPVDPLSMTLALETTQTYGYYYVLLDPASIPLVPGPGVNPGYYRMTSWWVLELP